MLTEKGMLNIGTIIMIILALIILYFVLKGWGIDLLNVFGIVTPSSVPPAPIDPANTTFNCTYEICAPYHNTRVCTAFPIDPAQCQTLTEACGEDSTWNEAMNMTCKLVTNTTCKCNRPYMKEDS